MLDILTQKLLSWTPELANAFYNGVDRYSQSGDLIWETTPTGFFIYGCETAEYRDYNGKSYLLQFGDRTELYTKKKEFSDRADLSKTILIEKPTLIQTCEIIGVTATYIEQSRPYNTYGIPFINLISVAPDHRLAVAKEIFPKAMLATDQFIQTIDVVNGDLSLQSYPGDLHDSMFYDPVTENLFLAGPINLTNSREEFFTFFSGLTTHVEQLLELPNTGFQSYMIDIINTQCTILHYP